MTHPDENVDAETAFGAAVRAARTAREWTQDQLRRRLLDGYGIELSKTAMIRLEGGQRPIRLNEVHGLAQLLAIDIAGFGGVPRRDAGDDDPTLRLAVERRSAIRAELAAMSAHAEILDSARAETNARMSRLKATATLLESLVGRIAAGHVAPEREMLDRLLTRDASIEGDDGDR